MGYLEEEEKRFKQRVKDFFKSHKTKVTKLDLDYLFLDHLNWISIHIMKTVRPEVEKRILAAKKRKKK